MNKFLLLSLLSFPLFFNACNIERYDTGVQSIAILPFEDIKNDDIESIRISIEKFYGYDVTVLPIVKNPKHAYNSADESYDAKKVLTTIFNKKEKTIHFNQVIGLINAPIKKSNSKKTINYPMITKSNRRNNISVISIYSINNTNLYPSQNRDRLKKIALREIGDLLGLRHCKANNQCLMNKFDKNTGNLNKVKTKLCGKCAKKLGWK
ncbi:MAG: hypothetical protein ACPG19_06955 [Saprospiraceae bacterium]